MKQTWTFACTFIRVYTLHTYGDTCIIHALAIHLISSILYVQIADHFKDPKDCFVEVINQVFIPSKTMWADLIALCDEAGFEKMSNDLQEAYRTG